MIRREKARALILSRKKLGEADRLITLFSRERGLARVVAKGVRRIPSRRGGHVEPFTQVLVVLSSTRGAWYLAAVEPLAAYADLHRDPAAMDGALWLARAVMGLCEEGQEYASVFDGLHEAFEWLPRLPAAQRHVLESALVLHLLKVTGYQPKLEACHVCGQTRPTEAVVLDGRQGGWRCLACHDSFAGTNASLPPRLLRATQWLAHNPHQALRLRVEALEGQQIVQGLRQYLNNVL